MHLVLAIALLLPALAFAQVTPYSQDFEGLTSAPEEGTTALGDDGWLLYVNVFNSGGGYMYGYGVFPAPNVGTHVSAVVEGEGGGMVTLVLMMLANWLKPTFSRNALSMHPTSVRP